VNIPVYYELFDVGGMEPMDGDYVWHVDEHPSSFCTLPSSHCYAPCFIPSPQIVEHEPFTNGDVHP